LIGGEGDDAEEGEDDDFAQELRALGFAFGLTIPLRSRARVQGVLTVLSHRSALDPADVTLAVGITEPRAGDQRPDGVDDHDAGIEALHLALDGFEDSLEAALQGFFIEVDEADELGDLVAVEERELLLIAQHLEGRLAQHREEEHPAPGGAAGEGDLVRQGRLARPGAAGDQVERVLGEPASDHGVKPGHPGDNSAAVP